MQFDPAAVHGERGRLDRTIFAPKNAACFSFRQIPVTHLRDRDCFPRAGVFIGRVGAAGDDAELYFGLVAGLLDRQHAIASDHDPSAATLGIPVLKDKGLQTGRDDTDTKASQFAIP